VRMLVNGIQSPGRHEVVWDGTNSDGQRVSSAVYFYRLNIENRSEVVRIIYLR